MFENEFNYDAWPDELNEGSGSTLRNRMKAGQLRECRSFLDHSVAESWESGSDFYAPGDYSLRIQRSQSERDLTGARKEGVKRAGG